MFRLACKLLFARKTWLILLTISFSLILAVVTSIFTASESIKMGIVNHAYNDYGAHSLTILHTNKSKDDLYQKNKDVKKVGSIQLIGTVDLKNHKTATVGIMDHDAIELGHLSLIAGTFPKEENEVVIESSYLPYIDNSWEIGQKRTLKINGIEHEFILSGIIKDYSAKWSVPTDFQRGVDDFPNIILAEKSDELPIKYQNYLVQLKGNFRDIEEKIANFLYEQNGFENSRLFYIGLYNYDHISLFSFIFQSATLLTSLLIMYSLLYFFNVHQQKKLAILKMVGSSNHLLIKISLAQVLIVILLGILFAVPLQFILHTLIIKNSFHVSSLDSANLFYIVAVIIFWILIIIGISFFGSVMALKKMQNQSINMLLKETGYFNRDIKSISVRTENFVVKKLIQQLRANYKSAIIVVLSLAASILIFSLSVYIEKEAHGIWEPDEDYYLNSQQTSSYETVDNLNVLFQDGLTFMPEDLTELENHPAIKCIVKIPFMVDIHPLLREEQITPEIEEWFLANETHATKDYRYKEYYIVPKVNYLLLDQETFQRLYPDENYEEFLGQVILYYPAKHKTSEFGNLIGETITFVQKKRVNDTYETNMWDLKVWDVIHEPTSLTSNDLLTFENDSSFTIILAEETAIYEGMFRGYHILIIYLKDHINYEEREQIESEIMKLIALTPGSLYQDMAKMMADDKRISDYIGYLGKLTYSVSALLAIMNLTIIMFSKYRLQKREWGIYFTLGMRKKAVSRLFYLEMLLYLLVATILSFIIFTLIVLSTDHVYPYLYYLPYFCLSIMIILLLLTVGWCFIKRVIDKQSIYSLIRIKE